MDQVNLQLKSEVRGNLYERLILDKLRGLDSDIDALSFIMEAGHPNTKICLYTISSTKSMAMDCSTLSDITNLNKMWIPHQSNFKSFDVLVASQSPSLWIQITVGKTHPLNVSGVHQCLELVSNISSQVEANIVFCLPPDIFLFWYNNNTIQNFVNQSGKKAITHQYLNTKKQFVICIPGDAVEEQQVKQFRELNLLEK